MSVSHPLLKQLKGTHTDFKNKSATEVRDHHTELQNLCTTLEEIFRKGLKVATSTPFGLMRKDYWFWIHHLYEVRDQYRIPFALVDVIESVKNNKKVHTNVGRGRLFIRSALTKKVLQALIDTFMIDEVFVFSFYDPHTAILGNEILSEILSSLLHEINKIDFKLELKNASFLDETWALGIYRKYEFVPCKEMGITYAYIKGRIVVVKVQEGSVAAEENQIEPGDVLDELYGQSLYRCSKGLISSLSNKYRGMPVYLSVIKGTTVDNNIYFPLEPIVEKLNLRYYFEKKLSKTNNLVDDLIPHSGNSSLIFNLVLLGKFAIENGARAELIERSINQALELKLKPKDVIMEITERELTVSDKEAKKVMVNKHFSEISACGRKKACPEIFAFIFGNTTCTIADEFACFVLRAPSNSIVSTILSSVAHGFVKTHWEV
ncbi:uncharacterized protein LOC129220686 [Uloborus diversus]|uniref:uncharacterized protein LOC129220686 n=1 Tax=Uloborus diversus TaxID=327109 RepID=UPI0024091E5A|nr:uncharacterized protein LOC129220686 [Uloborus diversus]